MAITDTPRPVWVREFPYEVAKWLRFNRVVKVELHSEASDDGFGSTFFIVAYGKDEGASMRIEMEQMGHITLHASYRTLIEIPRDMEKMIDDTEAWDKAHKRERREYERLKRKFGDK